MRFLGIDERPASWWESLILGWQHTLVDISPFVLPLAVATAVGLDARDTARLISMGLVTMGLATLLQTTLGNRLPIVQGPSATVIGALAPIGAQLGAGVLWMAALLGGVIEGVLGASGLIGRLRRLLPPMVSGTVIVAIGLGLSHLALRLCLGDGSGTSVAIAGAVVVTVLALRAAGQRRGRGLLARSAIFCAIFAIGVGLGSALSQVRWELVVESRWFALPTPFPFGAPWSGWRFSGAALLVVLAGYAGSMVESIGDYAATCAVSNVTFERRHIDRGLFAEGASCALAAVLGGLPSTSYTQNIGIIATTGVASRFVVRIAAVILLLYGLCPKFGALLVAIPRPALGGVFLLVCGSILAAGLELIAADPDPRGKALVVGVPLVLATALPSALSGTTIAWLPEGGGLRLVLTNGVVLAVGAGILMHAVVRGIRTPA